MADTPITWDDVVLLAGDMADITDVEVQDAILDWVNNFLNPAMFTTRNLKKARVYLAAHVATTSLPGGAEALGAVTSETVGGISRTYEAIGEAAGGNGYDATNYGKIFAMLLRTSKARLPRVI